MSDTYHFFTDSEYAGPNHGSLLTFWDREPRTLRARPRALMPEFVFPESGLRALATIATPGHAMHISRFFNEFYRGSDWEFTCNYADVERWIKAGFIILVKHDNEIVGTFICRVLDGVYCGKHNPQAALLEGLVVHPKFRKIGLASFLLASMDYIVYNTSKLNKSILLWFREHDSHLSAYSQLPISVLKYSYAIIKDLPKTGGKAEPADADTVKKIVKHITEKTRNTFTLLCEDSDEDVRWYTVNNSLIGIAFTHRIGKGGFNMWEVVFAANFDPPHFANLQEAIEIAALSLPCNKGIIFATNGLSRGNLSSPSEPWSVGNSGFLTTHVYNWMPPHFLTGDIILPKSCI
jgi:GNAT superfamily N-acetyltransferase